MAPKRPAAKDEPPAAKLKAQLDDYLARLTPFDAEVRAIERQYPNRDYPPEFLARVTELVDEYTPLLEQYKGALAAYERLAPGRSKLVTLKLELIALLLCCAFSVFVGWLAYVISGVIFLMILFPAFMGFAASFAYVVVVEGLRLRPGVVRKVIAGGFGLLTYVSMFGFGYLSFQSQPVHSSATVQDYLVARAAAGVSIASIRTASRPVSGSGTLLYVLWAAEAALATGAAVLLHPRSAVLGSSQPASHAPGANDPKP